MGYYGLSGCNIPSALSFPYAPTTFVTVHVLLAHTMLTVFLMPRLSMFLPLVVAIIKGKDYFYN